MPEPEFVEGGTEESIAAGHTGWLLLAAGVILILLVLLFYTRAYPHEAPFTWPQSYTVELTVPARDINGQDTWSVNKYTVDGEKVRNDLLDGHTAPVILRLDRAELITLNTQSSSYHITTVHTPMLRPDPFPTNGTWRQEAVELVNGKLAIKYKLTTDTSILHVWLDAQTDTPMQIANESSDLRQQFSKYSDAVPDAQLFEPPSSYTKSE